MAEPFVFYFRRSESGQPEQMYLADVRAECGLCKHPQLQRFYHSTPVHPVTTQRLTMLALNVRQKTGYECPNCGEQVAPEHARSTALTWAFPDDAGLIRAFLPDADDPGSLRWQFVEARRLDPQELPGWEPHPGEPVFEVLDEDDVDDALGRVVSPKQAIREVLADWSEDPSGGAVARITDDMWIIAEGPHTTYDDLSGEVGNEVDEELVKVRLDDSVPVGLPTHREPEDLPGRIGGWLPRETALDQVSFLLSAESASASLERAFSVANLEWERTAVGYEQITTPRGQVYPRDLPIMAVLRRAVYTGLTPGDAARLTAEEIVGTLLRVW